MSSDRDQRPSAEEALPPDDRRSAVTRQWLRTGLQQGGPATAVKILLVDDRESNLAALEATLTTPDYTLVKATSGEEALKRMLEDDFAVVVLDVMMPGMDGYEVASLMKRREKTRHVPIIFLTATSRDLASLYRSYAVGAVDCLTKPGDPDVIRAKVAVFAELFRKNEQLQRQAAELHQLKLDEHRRESERRYRNLAEAVPQIVWTAGPDGHIDYLNSCGRAYLGLDGVSAVADWDWKVALHPDDASRFGDEWHRAVGSGEGFVAEVRLKRARDGNYRWHLCRGAPEGDGPIVAWLGTLTDIEDQKRAQGRSAFLAEASHLLASSRLDFSATLERVSRLAVPELADWCVVYVLAEDGRLERLSVNHIDPTKMARASELDKRWPADPNAARGVYQVLRSGVSELYESITDELLIAAAREPDHLAMLRELGMRSAMIVPMRALGEVNGVISLISTSDGRHYTRDDLAMAEDLAHRAALAVDNARLYAQARESIRARDEFLLIAAHELKTPLTALQLQVQRLQRDELPDHARSKTDGAARAVGRLAKLVDVVLDVSRVSAGRLTLTRESTDLAALTREVVARLGEDAERAGVVVEVRDRGPSLGEWDRGTIDQVLSNLLSNAIKYGAGHPIEVLVDGDDQLARVSVRDHGIGIAAAAQGRIFDRFARAVSERNYGGLGLGLFIAREIVSAHGGKIRVASSLGDGAEFVVELPRRP